MGMTDELNLVKGTAKIIKEYREVLVDSVKNLGDGQYPEPVHKIRVISRRLRCVFKLLPDSLQKAAPDKKLKEFGNQFSDIRDLDAWITYLEAKYSPDSKTWEKYLKQLRKKQKKYYQHLKKKHIKKQFSAILEKLDKLYKKIKKNDEVLIEQCFVKTCLEARKPYLDHVMHLKDNCNSASPDEMHEIRRAIRKGRYFGELVEIMAPDSSDKYTAFLRGIANLLGELHDIDLHLDENGENCIPAELHDVFSKRRQDILTELLELAHSID